MKYTVKNRFKQKSTGKVFNPGDIFETDKKDVAEWGIKADVLVVQKTEAKKEEAPAKPTKKNKKSK